jgi:hypothetical protein
MIIHQGWSALWWVPIGYYLGVFTAAKVILPLISYLPIAIYLVFKKQMRPAVIGNIILVFLIWVILLSVVAFLIGFFSPSTATYLYSNLALNLSTNLGTIFVILSPLFKEFRTDQRREFDIIYGRFYMTSNKLDTDDISFDIASNLYDVAFKEIEPYTERANHRYAISLATRALFNNDDQSAADIYDETVAYYKDPADFEPYTETYLDAHTIAIDRLSEAFDNLSAILVDLSSNYNFCVSNSDLYKLYCELYEVLCDSYTFAAKAYSYAAVCAIGNALEGRLQSQKDQIDVMKFEGKTLLSPIEVKRIAPCESVAYFKLKIVEDANNAKALEQKAKIAESKAKVYLTKASTTVEIAEVVLQKQSNKDQKLKELNETSDMEYQRTNEELNRLNRELNLLKDPKTIYSFGMMSFDGDGVPQDYVEAANWFRIAAEQGHAKSQHNLALMYESGQGVSQDYAEASKWYFMAAENGYASSQNNLGALYETGDGVKQDHNEAIMWYRIAAENGDENAPSNLSRLEAIIERDKYQTIVFAYSDLMSTNRPLIGDCSILPYPKQTILYAIQWVMDDYRTKQEATIDQTQFETYDTMLSTLSYLLTRLALDWQEVEHEDKDAIAKLGGCESFPDWALPLQIKYINDERASNEAAEAAFQVMKDKVDRENRHGNLLDV